MTELQQNRYDRLLRRVGGLIGAKSMVNDALGELFPVIEVEDVPAELLALMGTQLGFCSQVLSASVGDFNHHQLFNPAASQKIVTVTQVIPVSTVDMVFRFTNFIIALGTLVGNERRRDTRAGVLATLVAQQRSAQDGTSGGLDTRVRTLANQSAFVSDSNEISVLFPGTGLTVSTESTNVESIVSFLWRERVFEQSEDVDSG